jgi:Na+/proline symporter
MGGVRAVIWTDTIQTFVLLGGALLSYIIILSSLNGGFTEFWSIASAQNKFNLVNWNWSASSFSTTAFWVVLLGGLGQQLVPYASDQAVVQRYMAVRDKKSAARAIWTNAITVIPASLLFFGIGTALFVFYKTNPEHLDSTFQTDAIFALFIARELPIGIAGLVVAGIFAAAQSTISTSMNSTSTAIVTDFVRRFDLLKSEKAYLHLARILTFVLGCLGTALALLFVASDVKSLWDSFMAILGLFGGSMCGLFLLGIFTKRANGFGALIGAILGAVTLALVQQYSAASFLLYASIGITVCFITGYLASFFTPKDKNSTAGLTIYTLHK